MAGPGGGVCPMGAGYSVGWGHVGVNGQARPVRYAHDLRISPQCRNGMILIQSGLTPTQRRKQLDSRGGLAFIQSVDLETLAHKLLGRSP